MSNTTEITFTEPPSSGLPPLILGTLAQLKTFLLPTNQLDNDEFDTALQAIGKGVAEQLQRFCNRQFPRLTGATQVFGGDLRLLSLRRYPVEAVSAFQVRDDVSEDWIEEAPDYQLDSEAGLVRLYAALATEFSLVRVTYSGGYWVDQTADGSGVLPSGATELPEDLRLAWLLQCQAVWSIRDNVGAAALAKKDYEAIAVARLLSEAKAMPAAVIELLNPYRKLA